MLALVYLSLTHTAWACYEAWCDSSMVRLTQVGNGVCNYSCMTESCAWDGGDCVAMCGCLVGLLSDGNCDSACNTWECGYDGGDCSKCKKNCEIYT